MVPGIAPWDGSLPLCYFGSGNVARDGMLHGRRGGSITLRSSSTVGDVLLECLSDETILAHQSTPMLLIVVGQYRSPHVPKIASHLLLLVEEGLYYSQDANRRTSTSGSGRGSGKWYIQSRTSVSYRGPSKPPGVYKCSSKVISAIPAYDVS